MKQSFQLYSIEYNGPFIVRLCWTWHRCVYTKDYDFGAVTLNHMCSNRSGPRRTSGLDWLFTEHLLGCPYCRHQSQKLFLSICEWKQIQIKPIWVQILHSELIKDNWLVITDESFVFQIVRGRHLEIWKICKIQKRI